MIKKIAAVISIMMMLTVNVFSQTDTITENFNNICDQTLTLGRTYKIDYTGANGIEWNLSTLYSSSPWWGGIDDDGEAVTYGIHCGSLQWDENNVGYARATVPKGIKNLSFQMKYGFQLVGGYVKVIVDGAEIGRTETLQDRDVHTFTFEINTPGPVDLELIPVIETTDIGGMIVDNITIITSDQSVPFFRVETIEGFDPEMDTLLAWTDTFEIYFYAEHCMMVNGEFVDYFDPAYGEEIMIGSIIDLNPGDSCNLYYWGSVTPGVGSSGGDLSVGLSIPANDNKDSINVSTTGGEEVLEGIMSFLNGNIDYDLIIFRLPDPKHEYRINFSFDSYPVSKDTTVTDTTRTAIGNQIREASVRFYPNPVRNYAWFETGKELSYYEGLDIQGHILFRENNPQLTGEGHYRLDLEKLNRGICIIRFVYTDNTMDAVRVILN